MSELLKVENLTINSANQTLVDNLSYTLQKGETLAIVGESGSRKIHIKSSLTRVITK